MPTFVQLDSGRWVNADQIIDIVELGPANRSDMEGCPFEARATGNIGIPMNADDVNEVVKAAKPDGRPIQT